MKRLLTVVAAIGAQLACLSPVLGQVIPDAGSVLKELERTEPAPKPPATKPELRVPEEHRVEPADAGAKIPVRGFRITGATLISAEELQQEISGEVGREHTIPDLQRLALRLSNVYLKKGFFARALLPQQRFVDGVVEIFIIEGRLGAVDGELLPGTRYTLERARQFIIKQQPLDAPLSLEAVRWGMRNLNDLPGVAAAGVLQPGKAHGEVNLAIRVESTPLFTANAYTDNFGLRATGQARVIGQGQLNSLFGYGDQLSLLGVVTERSDYEKLGYSFPVGYSGLRANVSAAQLGYRLSGAFNGFSGTAAIFGASLLKPLRRTAASNFFGALTIEHKHFVNDASGGVNLNNKRLNTAALEFRGDFTDTVYRPAKNAFSVSLVVGELDLGRNTGSLRVDQTGPQTQGGFTKLPWSFQRVEQLPRGWELNLTASGQFTGGNLDAYEKFAIGGPAAVRAYPAGEAPGDDAWVASLELRHVFNAELQATGFLDVGHVARLHHTFPGFNAGNPNQPNNYFLYGMGFGVTYGRTANWFIKGSIASKLGSNPGRDANGKDADGGNSHVRAWIQLAKYF